MTVEIQLEIKATLEEVRREIRNEIARQKILGCDDESIVVRYWRELYDDVDAAISKIQIIT